jgi:osmoprotectant transport system permease protein
VSDELALLPGYLTAHLQLSLLALVAGGLLSIPLGVFVARRPRLEGLVLGIAAVAQTIPSLALLALMVPLLAALGVWTAAVFGLELRSIGFLPAWLALALYSVLPMLRNTVTGIGGVDPALVEAARGVGMTERQQLLRVELPLALPVIVAGVRTASVWVVGTATLATPVGATSLGNFIFSGLQTRNFAAVVLGSVSSAALALLLDALVRALERGLVARRRALWGGALAGLSALYAFVGVTLLASAGGGVRPIAIGSKTFTEQYVLAALLAQTVEEAGAPAVRRVESLGSTVAFDALRTDELDLYVDYSGTIWATILERSGLPGDRASVLAEVRTRLAADYGIAVVAALGFENTYAIAMREDRATELGVESLGELARHAPALSIGADYEFFSRAEWKALQERYGLRFADQRSMDPALMYAAVDQREVDAISAFSTDGRVAALGLRLLRDELGVIPPYDAIVLASPRFQREWPRALTAIAALDGAIDAAAMQRMNSAVDQAGEQPAAVAARFRSQWKQRSREPGDD